MDKFELSKALSDHKEISIVGEDSHHSSYTETDGKETMEANETEKKEEFQEAFDEETGEINWDCPCLGEMVKEPCGEKFKAAFSCFVYSKEEVKGSDCVEQFREMQKCFQSYPEIYGAELGGDSGDAADSNASKDVGTTEESTNEDESLD